MINPFNNGLRPVEPATIKVIVYVSDGINKPVEASGVITVISPPSPPPASTEPPTNPVVADPPVSDPIPKEEWQLFTSSRDCLGDSR